MVGKVLVGVRTRQWAALSLGLLTCITASIASAADCPGHPDALGTSRTLVVDPRVHPRIGTMQYAETLPLRDHEVVLTFDDGPLPHNSNQILEILASQCVKATFFTVGSMAQNSPEGVRKLREAGHTIATHTQTHPIGFDKFSPERAKQEIDEGIASVTSILHEMKARGYHIVHVVPATSQQPNTPTEPLQWQLHPPSETVAISHWPTIPNFVYAEAGTLPAPSLPDSGFHDGRLVSLAEPFDRTNRRARGVPLPRHAPWPRQSPPPLGNAAIVLPVPAQNIFEIH